MVERARQDGYAAAASPEAAVGDHGAQPFRVGVEQFAVKAAEDDAVGVEDVDESGEAESETVDELLAGSADRGVVVLPAQQFAGLLEQRDLGSPGGGRPR